MRASLSHLHAETSREDPVHEIAPVEHESTSLCPSPQPSDPSVHRQISEPKAPSDTQQTPLSGFGHELTGEPFVPKPHEQSPRPSWEHCTVAQTHSSLDGHAESAQQRPGEPTPAVEQVGVFSAVSGL